MPYGEVIDSFKSQNPKNNNFVSNKRHSVTENQPVYLLFSLVRKVGGPGSILPTKSTWKSEQIPRVLKNIYNRFFKLHFHQKNFIKFEKSG